MYDKKNRPIFGCCIKNKYKKLGIYDEEEKKISSRGKIDGWIRGTSFRLFIIKKELLHNAKNIE